MPPVAGTANSCDSSRSPATVAEALTRNPGFNPLNSARPMSFVVACSEVPGPVISTVWLGIGFANEPRITRTVTVPADTSLTGSGTPDICRGFGISCARAGNAAGTISRNSSAMNVKNFMVRRAARA